MESFQNVSRIPRLRKFVLFEKESIVGVDRFVAPETSDIIPMGKQVKEQWNSGFINLISFTVAGNGTDVIAVKKA